MILNAKNLKIELLNCPQQRETLMNDFEASERELRRFVSKRREAGDPIFISGGVYRWDREKFKGTLKTYYKTALSMLRVYGRYNKKLKHQLQYDLFGGKKRERIL